jgi:hypothetical protein
MKKHFVVLAAGILTMMSGCSTPTVLQAPVGPDPLAAKTADPNGTLRVYSATEVQNNVGFEFPYSQRTDYYIYDVNGMEIHRVTDNNQGHFEGIPTAIHLKPGTFRVKALAAVGEGEWITVPVVIESGRTTEVHLNGHWKPPTGTPDSELVKTPAGFPVGWRAPTAPNG